MAKTDNPRIVSVKDTAKELVRIAGIAGVSKDIIDLMETKLDLLAGEVADLANKNAALEARVSQLEVENGQLRSQIKNPQQS
jgi:outer membrane murein-binding lipoprotein Lpp